MSNSAVIINSLPKSGTNLLVRLMSMLPGMQHAGFHIGHSTSKEGAATEEKEIPVGVDMPRMFPLNQVAQPLGLLKAGQYVSAHLPYSDALDTYLQQAGIKMLVMLRDPRDVAVSHAKYIASTNTHPLYQHYAALDTSAQFSASIHGVVHETATLLPIQERLQSVLAWEKSPQALVLSFEELVGAAGQGSDQHQKKALKSIAAFLGISISDEVIDNVRQQLFGTSSTFRKGQIGGWQDDLGIKHVEAIEASCSTLLDAAGYKKKEPGEQLIFLVSQPRAGSTLMQRVLGGNSDVFTLAEPWLMLHPIYALRKQGIQTDYDSGLARAGLDDFISALPNGRADYLDGIRAMSDTLYSRVMAERSEHYFLDKTPRYYHILPELNELFPGASIVVLLRNPLAVLSSILKTWVGKNWLRLQLHRDDVFRAPGLLVKGLDALGTRAIVIRYEDFVRAPEARMKHLCTMLDLPYEPAMLNYGEQPAPAGSMGDSIGVHQHSRPATSSLEKWKKTFEDPIYKLLAEIMLTVVGSETCTQLGYNFETLWNDLKQIPCTPDTLTQEEIVSLTSSLRFSADQLSQIEHLFVPYLTGQSIAEPVPA